ncbi:MAG: acyl-CoA thioesterase [Muribaculaceae bacterium]|nr:acyl-CoA thioesterase [Muribaculaceae bacterium]
MFSTHIKVRDYETDSQGIVNNANYLHYLEITRHDFCEARGTSFRAMQQQWLDPVVRKIEIEYLSSLTMDDVMESRLTVERHGARFIFVQDIYNASTGAHVVHAQVTVVILENGRLSRGDKAALMLGIES